MNEFRTIFVHYDNCSNKCRHCFCKPVPFCSLHDFEQLLDSLQNEGADVKVYITDQGRPEIRHILKRVGYGLIELKDEFDYDHVEQLQRPGTKFGISLHGHRADIHELPCGKGNFDKTIKALEEAKRINLPNTRVYCVVHKINYLYIEKLCELVQKYGVKNISFLRLSYMGRARNLPHDMFLDEDSFIHFFNIFDRVRARLGSIMDMGLVHQSWGPRSNAMLKFDYIFNKMKGKHKYFCAGGHDKITVNAGTREIYSCGFSITDSRFRIGRYDDKNGIVIDRPTIQDSRLFERIGEPCKSCGLLKWCGGHCRGTAIADHLRLTGEIDMYAGLRLCPIALGIKNHLGIRALKKKAHRVIKKCVSDFAG